MQAIDRLTRIELTMKQENQETVDPVDDDVVNLHVSRSRIFFWALRKPQVAGYILPMGGRG